MKLKQKKGVVKFQVPFVVEVTGESTDELKVKLLDAVGEAESAITKAIKTPKRVAIVSGKVHIG